MSTKGTGDVSLPCYSLKEGDVSVIHSELGADVHSSLVTFALETTPDPPPDPISFCDLILGKFRDWWSFVLRD